MAVPCSKFCDFHHGRPSHLTGSPQSGQFFPYTTTSCLCADPACPWVVRLVGDAGPYPLLPGLILITAILQAIVGDAMLGCAFGAIAGSLNNDLVGGVASRSSAELPRIARRLHWRASPPPTHRAGADHRAHRKQQHDRDDLAAENDAVQVDGRVPGDRLAFDHIHTSRRRRESEPAAKRGIGRRRTPPAATEPAEHARHGDDRDAVLLNGLPEHTFDCHEVVCLREQFLDVHWTVLSVATAKRNRTLAPQLWEARDYWVATSSTRSAAQSSPLAGDASRV